MQIHICMYGNGRYSGRPGPQCGVWLHKHVCICAFFYLGFAVTFSSSKLAQPLFLSTLFCVGFFVPFITCTSCKIIKLKMGKNLVGHVIYPFASWQDYASQHIF